VNAFALPGGHVVIYDGILKRMKEPDELAALLSHEVAHIQYKHSLKGISRNLAGYMFIALLFNDINGISTVLIENANTLNNLHYSRSLETEADLKALKTLERNNIDQHGMVRLFETLNTKSDLSYLKILSTHPLTAERIKYTKSAAKRQRNVRENKEMQLLWKSIKGAMSNR
jgi:beta-barrel assembly-enhancing protease